MDHNITIDVGKTKRFGFLEGAIDEYRFYAMVHKDVVTEALCLETMDKGPGRISKICIYQDEVSEAGNPFLPAMSIKRHIYINFEYEWKVYNYKFQQMLDELMNYLMRRAGFNIHCEEQG